MITPLRHLFSLLLGRKSAGRNAAFEGQRDYSRAEVNAKVTIFLEGRTFQGQLRDVSISGAMLEPHCDLVVGDSLELELANIPGRVQAQVMRLVDEKIGVRFTTPGVGVLIAGWSRGTSTATLPAGGGS